MPIVRLMTSVKAMELPEGFTSLPLPALVVFAACFGIVGALVYFGVINGKKAPAAESRGGAEIVALTVDSRSIDKLAGEAAGLAVAITDMKQAMTESAKDVVRSNDELREQVQELAVQMRITREVRQSH